MRLLPMLLGSALFTVVMPSAAFAQFEDPDAELDEAQPAVRPVQVKVLRQPAAVVAGARDRIAGGRQINQHDDDDAQGGFGAALPGSSRGAGRAGGQRGGTGNGRGSGGFGSAGAADADRGGFDGAMSGPDNENGSGLSGGGGLNSRFGGYTGDSGGSRNSQAEELANGNDSGVGNSQKGRGGNSGGSGFEGYGNSAGSSPSDYGYNSNGRNSGHGSSARQGRNGNSTATADHSAPGGMSVGFSPSGNTAKGPQGDPANSNYGAGPNSGKTADNSAHDDGGRDDGNHAADSSSSNQRNKNDNTTVEPQPDNSGSGKDQAQKSGGSAPDRPEDEGFSARTDAVGKAAARRRFDGLSRGRANRDLLGENRDEERTDDDGGLQEAAGRINPLTGAKVIGAPTGSGTSPILRNEVEIAKKRKTGL